MLIPFINASIPFTPMLTHFPSPHAPPNSLPNIPKKSWATWDFFMCLNYVNFFLYINTFNFFIKGLAQNICPKLHKFEMVFESLWSIFAMDRIWCIWNFLCKCICAIFHNGQVLGCLNFFRWKWFFLNFYNGQNQRCLCYFWDLTMARIKRWLQKKGYKFFHGI